MWNRLKFLLFVLLVLLFDAQNGFCAGYEHAAAPLKVAFVMVGPVNDFGYNYSHNLGRLYLQSHLPNVQTTFAENIPENAEVERVMEKMIAAGNRLIFSTSFGYLEPAERVAKRHPEVVIMQTWRPGQPKNMGCYVACQYEPNSDRLQPLAKQKSPCLCPP